MYKRQSADWMRPGARFHYKRSFIEEKIDGTLNGTPFTTLSWTGFNTATHQRTIIQPTTADAMIATSCLSFGSVPEWKAVEIKYTRWPK